MLLVVMCRLGLEALSQPKPALGSQARPELQWWLHEAYGSGFNSVKPEPRPTPPSGKSVNLVKLIN